MMIGQDRLEMLLDHVGKVEENDSFQAACATNSRKTLLLMGNYGIIRTQNPDILITVIHLAEVRG